MKLTRTFDTQSVRTVFVELEERIKEDDDDDPATLEFDFNPKNYYLLVEEADYNLAGLILLHPYDEVSYEIHMNMFPKYRGAFAVDAAKKAIEYVRYYECPYYIVAQIPDKYPNVQRFAVDFGLKHVGKSNEPWLQDGRVYNKQIYELELF